MTWSGGSVSAFSLLQNWQHLCTAVIILPLMSFVHTHTHSLCSHTAWGWVRVADSTEVREQWMQTSAHVELCSWFEPVSECDRFGCSFWICASHWPFRPSRYFGCNEGLVWHAYSPMRGRKNFELYCGPLLSEIIHFFLCHSMPGKHGFQLPGDPPRGGSPTPKYQL